MKKVHGHVEDAFCLNMQNNLRLPGATVLERAEKPEKQHGENNAQKYGGAKHLSGYTQVLVHLFDPLLSTCIFSCCR